jgi:monoamine oxidase
MMCKCFQILFLFLIAANSVFAEYKKIVVIGGGLAGLTTAYRLLKLTGEYAEVYEARPRVGGRVLTAHFFNSHEELGAKFLEAAHSKHLIALINEMKLEIENYATNILDRKYVYNGEVAPYYNAFLNMPFQDETTYGLLKQWSNEEKNLGGLLGLFFAKQEIPRHLAEIRMRGYEGNDTKDLSTKYLDSFWNYYNKCVLTAHGEGKSIAHHQTIKGGNSRLPEKLAEALKGHIHFNQPLRKISMTYDGKYLLEFPNSKTITTDCLVLAIPCSTLRDVEVERRIIPSDQWEAIHSLQYGTNGYILISVNVGDEDFAEYSVTEDTIVWFNKDRKILTMAFGGQVGIFDGHSSEDVVEIITREMPALKLLFPSIKYTGKKQAVSWLDEEFSKGSASSWGVGQFELFDETVELLGERVRKVFRPIQNRIFFAGEHASIDHPATMEGAVESGEKTARMIARIIKPAKEKETTGRGS